MKTNKLHIFVAVMLLAGFISVAPHTFAKDGSSDDVDETETENTSSHDTSRDAEKKEIRAKIETMREDNKKEREAMKEEIKSNRESVKTLIESGATREEIKAKIDAVQTENKAKREEFKLKLEEKRKTIKDEVKKEIENFKEGKKIKLDEAKKEKAKEKITNVSEKLNSAIDRLDAFDTRVGTIIAARKARGLDTSSAESALELARQALESAKVEIKGAVDGITSSLDGGTATSKEAVKSAIAKAVESIKTAKAKYIDVIANLPKIPSDDEATTTTK